MARVRRKITNTTTGPIQIAGRWLQPGASDTFDQEQLPPEWAGAGVVVNDQPVAKVPAMITPGNSALEISSTPDGGVVLSGVRTAPIPEALQLAFRGNSYLLKHRATTGAEAASWWAFVPVGAGYFNVFGIGVFGNPGAVNQLGRFCLGRIGTNVPANDASVTTVGAWTTSPSDVAPGGSYYYSTTAGDSKTFSVTGDAIVLRSLLNTNLGYAVVAIDGDWTAANRLPAFSQADADAGLCRAADVGRRYFNGYAVGTCADYHAVLAEGLTDGPHVVRFEATGTKPAASSAARAALGAIVGCSAADAAGVPGVAGRVIARLENVQHFYFGGSSAMAHVIELEKTNTAGSFDFLSEMHGGATLVSQTILVDGVDQSGLAVDTYTAGKMVRISVTSSIATVDVPGTPVANKTIDHVFSSYQQCPAMLSIKWAFQAAKNVRYDYPMMMPMGEIKPGGTVIKKARWDSVMFGTYQSSGSDLTTGDASQRGNVPALFAVAKISGTTRAAYCALLDGSRSMDYFVRSAPDSCFVQDRNDYLKMYFTRCSGTVRESFAAGEVLTSVIGYGLLP